MVKKTPMPPLASPRNTAGKSGVGKSGAREIAGGVFEAEPPARRERRAVRGISKDQQAARAVELHRRIYWAMAKAEVSEEAVAAVAGISTESLRNLRRPEGVRNPSFFSIIAIAAHLRVSPFWLAAMTEDPEGFLPPRVR